MSGVAMGLGFGKILNPLTILFEFSLLTLKDLWPRSLLLLFVCLSLSVQKLFSALYLPYYGKP